MILHTFNSSAAWQQFNHLIAANDRALLLENGVLVAVAPVPDNVAVLEPDARARGLAGRIKAQLISDTDFVQWCCDADKVCSWSA